MREKGSVQKGGWWHREANRFIYTWHFTTRCIFNNRGTKLQLIVKGVPDDQRCEILNMKFEEGTFFERPGWTAILTRFQSKITFRSPCAILVANAFRS